MEKPRDQRSFEGLPRGWYEYFEEGAAASRAAGAEPWLSGHGDYPGTTRTWVIADGKQHKLPCQYAGIVEPCQVCALTRECGRYAERE